MFLTFTKLFSVSKGINNRLTSIYKYFHFILAIVILLVVIVIFYYVVTQGVRFEIKVFDRENL